MENKNTIELNNRIHIPLLGFGVWRVPSGEEGRGIIRTALEYGYRHIDTARVYCNEKAVGRAIKDSGIKRDELFVTTKLWRDDFNNPREGLMKSLERLGLDYVDLFLLHWPFTGYEQAYLELEKLYKEGYTRAIGVSNFKEHHIENLFKAGATIVPQINQVECHPENQETELLSYCRKKGIILEAYSPLGGQGFTLVNDPRIMAIASYYKVSAAQVILRFNVQRGVVVLPKSCTKERILQNSDIFSFELTNDDMTTLQGINADKRRAFDSDKINDRPESSFPVLQDEE